MAKKIILSPERQAQFLEDAKHQSTRELAEKYGVCSKTTISTWIRKYGIEKSDEYHTRIRKKVAESALQGRARMTPEQHRNMVINSAAALKALRAAERRRIVFGLPQRTHLHISLNYAASHVRSYTKSKLKRRNGYIDTGRNSRTLLYDSSTLRSRYLEDKYSKMFTFLPAEGFDESQSRFVNEKVWGVKRLGQPAR